MCGGGGGSLIMVGYFSSQLVPCCDCNNQARSYQIETTHHSFQALGSGFRSKTKGVTLMDLESAVQHTLCGKINNDRLVCSRAFSLQESILSVSFINQVAAHCTAEQVVRDDVTVSSHERSVSFLPWVLCAMVWWKI